MSYVQLIEDNNSLSGLIYTTGITFITGVPDSAFKVLIAELERSEMNQRYVLATREDNAVALAVGAYLAGEQPLVFMESSGIGNAIDALTSLATVYGIPLVLFIAWAGYKGRDVPHHNAIGVPLLPLLTTLDITTYEVSLADSLEYIAAAIQQAVTRATLTRKPVAVLGIPKELNDDER